MLTIGDRIPAFDLNAVVSIEPDKAFQRITNETNPDRKSVV